MSARPGQDDVWPRNDNPDAWPNSMCLKGISSTKSMVNKLLMASKSFSKQWCVSGASIVHLGSFLHPLRSQLSRVEP